MSALSASSELTQALGRVIQVMRQGEEGEEVGGYMSASASWQHESGSMISLTLSIGENPEPDDDDE